MTTIRPFTCEDMLKFNNVNLDPLTETYGLSFYTQYLAHWPEYFQVVESPSGEIMGYIMGKAEGHGENWHGHVTALTVSPDYRRLGLAATLMNILEDVSEKTGVLQILSPITIKSWPRYMKLDHLQLQIQGLICISNDIIIIQYLYFFYD
ncbi:N-alpha-acetyltransferase 20 isoform X2 [Hyposmocoma kahamanoa]|uniref:N-alpha-acetyltransferase 20 isoform X2 n=1 Tax=Hyposmocoma kahamanoa TaxID=1477025 RepID=UPI000E6D77B0|nr:N-alpha-acetyltransferase 20 isoform X2 [Hyposmocoma kahamanoa]